MVYRLDYKPYSASMLRLAKSDGFVRFTVCFFWGLSNDKADEYLFF